MRLNATAHELCDQTAAEAEVLRVAVHRSAGGTRVIDFGVDSAGGLEAGRRLAEVCMAGLGRVDVVPARATHWNGPAVQSHTDFPVLSCMASQYAGWQIAEGKFFAMGSGPMRTAAANGESREALFDKLDYAEKPDVAVGVLETAALPTDEVCRMIASACGVAEEKLTLLAAPTASQAGTFQVAARSVETAMHKLSELEFDVHRVESGWGVAPLPPIAKNDLEAIGRTNDAILYGGTVVLYVRGEDDMIRDLGPKVPSNSSPAHGKPFVEIFEAADRDFYKIDGHLFSPAQVTFNNLDTGNVFVFGEVEPAIVRKSFGLDGAS
ncbi:MAG: methenyltetrahydromethanopterin cyclohydrolase [Pirellulales bacterium]|nr:methenyltetrahydromethanopterin cyclohydrolase [Pirellulales bacterium]